jgi:hypothetical protein
MFRFAQGISVFALAACGLGAQTVVTPPVQVTRTSGMVGIAEGQTARLNTLNPGVAPAAAIGEICSGLLTFLGEDGKVLKSATVNVTPGTNQYLSIDSVVDLALAVNTRRDIRATITIPPVPPPTATSSTTPVTPVCKLIGTLEIYNTLDGRTLVTLGTVHVVPSPVATPGT